MERNGYLKSVPGCAILSTIACYQSQVMMSTTFLPEDLNNNRFTSPSWNSCHRQWAELVCRSQAMSRSKSRGLSQHRYWYDNNRAYEVKVGSKQKSPISVINVGSTTRTGVITAKLQTHMTGSNLCWSLPVFLDPYIFSPMVVGIVFQYWTLPIPDSCQANDISCPKDTHGLWTSDNELPSNFWVSQSQRWRIKDVFVTSRLRQGFRDKWNAELNWLLLALHLPQTLLRSCC